jgi:Domain of unknown function (DUF4832)/Domain of unknown function (DUF4874)
VRLIPFTYKIGLKLSGDSMRYIQITLTSCLLAFFSFSLAKEKTYSPSTENFPNPERGFFKTTQYGSVSASSSANDRKSKAITLQRIYFRLDAYRNGPIPQSFLDIVSKDLKNLRDGGCKGLIRFSYNYGEAPDAPLAIILGHISQLKPILMSNYDVIAFVEAGFIGHWGEWHDSTNDLDNAIARTKILETLLSSIPTERMVSLRYNYHKREIFKTDTPLGPSEAYQGTFRSRTGAMNDCLGASEEDWGTYTYNGTAQQKRASIEKEKTFLHFDNRYVPQGGETCNPSAYSGCDSALADLKRMRWDAVNESFHSGVLSSWSSGGCMETIKRQLGYRLQLTKATIQDSAKPGNTWSISFSIVNSGWGKIYNPRSLEIVLRQVNGQGKYYFPLSVNPQFWLSDEPATVTINAGIPKEMPEGEYKVFLNLPDPAKLLRNRPEYSIRLANPNVWEDSTGFNYLDANVFIKATARVQPLAASSFFAPWGTGSVTHINPSSNQGQSKRVSMPFPFVPFEKGWIDIRGRSIAE